jgi:hypothetical protein
MTPTNAPIDTLVLKNATGTYFLVPLATVEQGRVPEEHTAEVERLMAHGQDTSGYVLGWVIAGVGAGVALAIAEPGRFFHPIVEYDVNGKMHWNP